MNNQAIGVLDSGLGGLTVMRALMHLLPHENIIYVGDTLHCPYGEKTPKQIEKYVTEIADFLVAKKIKLLVLACNTATVLTLELLQQRLSIPVIGMINAASYAALQTSQTRKIGVIATEATVQTAKYTKTLRELDSDSQIIEQACPVFVRLVEQGLSHTEEAYLIAEQTLNNLSQTGIDTLILGCTHFPMMSEAIQSVMPNCYLIDPSQKVAEEVFKTLHDLQLLNNQKKQGLYQLYITKEEALFAELANLWLQVKFSLEEISLDAK